MPDGEVMHWWPTIKMSQDMINIVNGSEGTLGQYQATLRLIPKP